MFPSRSNSRFQGQLFTKLDIWPIILVLKMYIVGNLHADRKSHVKNAMVYANLTLDVSFRVKTFFSVILRTLCLQIYYILDVLFTILNFTKLSV